MGDGTRLGLAFIAAKKAEHPISMLCRSLKVSASGFYASQRRRPPIAALDAALKRRLPGVGLMHQSDQGCTYASEDYEEVLRDHGIKCSMSRRGDRYDNAVMESWFSTLKFELGE